MKTMIVLVDRQWRERVAEYTREKEGRAMTAPFRAFVVNQTDNGFKMGIEWLNSA